MTKVQLSPAEFFFCYAGFSYDPHKQTLVEGKMECAKALAMAERWASEQGLSFEWNIDDDPLVYGDETGQQWYCSCFDEDGKLLSSLGSIEFSDDVGPFGVDPYSRIIEAELALEALSLDGAASVIDPLMIRLDVCQQESGCL